MRLIRKNAHKSRWAMLIALVLLTACSGGADTAGDTATTDGATPGDTGGDVAATTPEAATPTDTATAASAPPTGGTEPTATEDTAAPTEPDAAAVQAPVNDPGSQGSLVVGSTNFDEQELIAEMYAQALEQAGFTVERRYQLGSREIVLPALTSGEIDVYPEYAATAVEFLNQGAGEASGDPEETTDRLRELFAEQGVDVLQPSAAQDQNTIVVTQETADELGLETVSDLAPVAGELVFGGPPECPDRPFCLPGYADVYGIEFAEFRALDAGGQITVQALASGEIDVALLFSTDPVIQEMGWVILEDDMQLQAADNIVPVIRQEVNNEVATAALDAVSAALTTEGVTEAVGRIRAGEPVDAVATDYLTETAVLQT